MSRELTPEPTVFDQDGTYIDTAGRTTHTVVHEWNHVLGEVVSSLLAAALILIELTEARQRPVQRAAGPHGLCP